MRSMCAASISPTSTIMMPAATDDRKRFPERGLPSPKKRRKTNIMKDFRSFSLNETHQSDTHFSPLGREMDLQHLPHLPPLGGDTNATQDMDNDSEITSFGTEDTEDSQLLSDREALERKVMLDLVLGTNSAVKKHPADVKLEEWVRREALIRKQREERQMALETQSHNVTQDDMELDHNTVYQTSNHPSLGVRDIPFGIPMQRERSNSLPGREEFDSYMDLS